MVSKRKRTLARPLNSSYSCGSSRGFGGSSRHRTQVCPPVQVACSAWPSRKHARVSHHGARVQILVGVLDLDSDCDACRTLHGDPARAIAPHVFVCTSSDTDAAPSHSPSDNPITWPALHRTLVPLGKRTPPTALRRLADRVAMDANHIGVERAKHHLHFFHRQRIDGVSTRTRTVHYHAGRARCWHRMMHSGWKRRLYHTANRP